MCLNVSSREENISKIKMDYPFRIGKIRHNQWVKLITKYPYIEVITEKLYEYSGIFDDTILDISIDIYRELLDNRISPKNAINRWNKHILYMKINYPQKFENINHYGYFQTYMQNINYYIEKN